MAVNTVKLLQKTTYLRTPISRPVVSKLWFSGCCKMAVWAILVVLQQLEGHSLETTDLDHLQQCFPTRGPPALRKYKAQHSWTAKGWEVWF